jgi:hypothetical protein
MILGLLVAATVGVILDMLRNKEQAGHRRCLAD